MKDGIVIQARTGSTRLHNKILLPFDGKGVFSIFLIGNIKAAFPEMCIKLATTVESRMMCWKRPPVNWAFIVSWR